LELGIDIGSVEKVVQIDAAHSISSLIQRVGRSGRRDGEKSSLVFYATKQYNGRTALQSKGHISGNFAFIQIAEAEIDAILAILVQSRN
jgi:Lhr-like helicase